MTKEVREPRKADDVGATAVPLRVERLPPLSISGDVQVDPERASLRHLRAAAVRGSPDLTRPQALSLLRASDYPNKHRDLERILVNERESPELRMLAAANLGKIDHPVALGILSANVGMVDDAIRAVIITSLGRIGNLDTLSLLSSQDHQGQGGLSSSAIRFAMTLLSYRFRVPGHELVLPEENEYVEAPNDGGFRLALTEANEAEAEYCLRCLAAKPFGIELSDSRIYQLRCWHNLSLVALNRDFVTEDAASRLAAGPAFLGLVAAADPETGTYHPTNLLLTSPGDPPSELNIFVCRLRGQITLAGGSTLDRSGISFVIRAVAHPGVRPTTIRGIFERGKLRMPSASATMYVRDKVSCSEARGV